MLAIGVVSLFVAEISMRFAMLLVWQTTFC
mgnify:CR=1 FL=1